MIMNTTGEIVVEWWSYFPSA